MSRQDDTDTIRGKVFLVTGSGRGLGACLIRAAAIRHARVVINYRTEQRAADTLAREVHESGGEALSCRADVTDYDQSRGLIEKTVRTFGRIDILVNAVGNFSWKPVAEMEPTEWRGMMASNLDSVYHMCRLALPHMRKHHFGRIVNLGAVGAERTLAQSKVSAYSAAKSAVIAFSKALALEEARSGITVNVVSPGISLEDQQRPDSPPTYAGRRLGDRVPVGRPGTPDDIVRAILFFASPAADFVTGQVLAVAGGWRL